MAEQRTKLRTTLLRPTRKGKADMALDVFDSRDWPDEPEAGAGLYRLRLGGKWLNEGGRKHTFFTVAALGQLLARELAAPGALLDMDAGRPDLRKGQYVRWWPTDKVLKVTMGRTKTVAASDPVHCFDGQWRIMISGIGFVPCDEVQGLDRFGRDIQPETAKEGA